MSVMALLMINVYSKRVKVVNVTTSPQDHGLPFDINLLMRSIVLGFLRRKRVVVCEANFLEPASKNDFLEWVKQDFQKEKVRSQPLGIFTVSPNSFAKLSVVAVRVDSNFQLLLFWLIRIPFILSMTFKPFLKRNPSLFAFAKRIKSFTSMWSKAKMERPENQHNFEQLARSEFSQPNWKIVAKHADLLSIPDKFRKQVLVKNISSVFPGPKGIHVALLNRCNLSCVMCPYHSPEFKESQVSGYFNKTRQMSEEIFDKVLEGAKVFGSSLQFGQIEEALIHPKSISWMKKAKAAGLHVHLTTNGTLLEGKKLEELAKAEIDSVMFSLDASSPELYRKIRGDDLDKVENNISNFLTFINEKGFKRPKVWVSFIMQDASSGDGETFRSKWVDLGIDNITFYKLSDIDAKTGRVKRSEFTYERSERYTCSSPWEQCVIYPEGEVSLCCQSMLETGWRGVVSMGDLRHESLQSIWVGREYSELRTRLVDNTLLKSEVCYGCDLWSSGTYFIEESALFRRIYNETSDTYEIKRSN